MSLSSDCHIYNLTQNEARKFILLKQGLLGEHKFTGKNGILEFVRQAGCIQFDPEKCTKRFAKFNECGSIIWKENF